MKKTGANDCLSEKCIRTALVLAIFVFGNADNAAAIEHGHWPHATFYSVVARSSDTVGTIANRYRVRSSAVASLNNLKATGNVTAGRVVLIPAITRTTREAVLSEAMDRSAPDYATGPGPASVPRPAVPPMRRMTQMASPLPPAATGIKAATMHQAKALRFAWPITGPVISSFGPGVLGTRNDGINIAAERGTPFRAAADGMVSYVGSLRGYGNLVLITHTHRYITAYAHADSILVARGEIVEKGQVIGTAGTTGGLDRPQLHFEIRRGEAPVDPSLVLALNS